MNGPAALLPVLLLCFPAFGSAQVEKVTMRTTGISCGICAAVSEIKFRRMPAVQEVAISLATESITLTYKPGAAFAPRELRQVLRPLEVAIVAFRITARGRIVEENAKLYLIAGRDKFGILWDKATALRSAGTVLVEGLVYDEKEPMELKLLTVHSLPDKPGPD